MLRDKIEILFDYRLFPQLYGIAKPESHELLRLEEKLYALQTAIYHLDQHLESNWNVDKKAIDKSWVEIFERLSRFEINPDVFDAYTAHIRKYQKHELELRDDVLPTRFKLEYFYFYKSCDVKLLRRLIYNEFDKLRFQATLPDWRYFDLITEINDDVEDVFEDMNTINANAFMISYFIQGAVYTSRKFNNYMDTIVNNSHQRFSNSKSELRRLIHEKTIENVRLTKDLMNKNLVLLKDYEMRSCELFRNLDEIRKKRV